MGKPWEKYGPAQPQTPARAPAPATNNVVAGPWAKYKTNPTAAFAQPKQSSYDEMAATPQRSVAGSAPQWAAEAPLMGGRTIQDEGREALQSAGAKLRVKSSGAQLDNRHNADAPDLLGGIGDLLKAGNFAVRDWWKNSSDKEKENLIASIPVEATGAGAIARLSDHIGQKTGNEFLKDKTGNFTTDANYDPVAELEMYLVNAGTWGTRNQVAGLVNPRGSGVGLVKELAPHVADVGTNLTMGLSDVGAAGVRGVANLASDIRARPGAPTPQPAQPAPAAAQSAPVTAVPPTQPRATGARQQPNAGNVPPAGPAQPVLNATPQTAPVSVSMTKSDARIIGRLLKAGGVARNDVDNLLTGLVQAYQGSNSSRLPLAFFAEEYLPTVLPKQTADDVIQKLRGFGRERYSANGPKDTSRSTMRNTVDTLRSTQQENLSGVMDANLYKGKLIGQEDKLNAQLEQNARTAYTTALENANNRLLSGRATQAERDALGEIQGLLHNGAFLKEVPAHMRIKAMRDGIDLEDFVQKDPIAAAHWLQSELRQAVTAAEGVGGMATSESRLYNEMRTTLLDQLEKVVPGYRGARKAHGDIYGAKEAIEFGGNFFKAARSEVETARLARQFKSLSNRQKTAATMSIRDALKNEFRNKAEDTAAKVTRLQQAGVLDALETVLGADGKRVADAIRATAKENERLRAVDQLSGSPTHDNTATAEAAQAAVRSPLNTAIKKTADKSNLLYTAGIDAMLMGSGLPPFATAGTLVGRAADKFGNPGAKQLSSVTKTLYDLPAQPNALAPPKRQRASGRRSPKPTPEETQATLDDLLRQYDALDHRANPAAGQKLLNQINKLKQQLAPPSSPPVKAGFGGSQTNMPPELGGAMVGGTVGYMAAPEDQKGAGAVLGALGGAGLGRIVRGAGPPQMGVPIKTPPFDGPAKLRQLLGEPSRYLPWHHNPRYKELAAKAGTVVGEVPVADIVPGQSQIRHNFREVAQRYGSDEDALPIVVRENGKYYINDGTHRIAAQVEDGAQAIRARIIDLDAASGAPSQNGFGGPSKPLDMSEAARMQRAAPSPTELNKIVTEAKRLRPDAHPEDLTSIRWVMDSDGSYHVAHSLNSDHQALLEQLSRKGVKVPDQTRENRHLRGYFFRDENGKWHSRTMDGENVPYPSQSGSSKLLAGFANGAGPELAVGAGSAAVASGQSADYDGDGVVSEEEYLRHRAEIGGSFIAGAFGANVARNAIRGGGNALRGVSKPRAHGPDSATFGGVKAKTADLKLQRIAQDMEKAGASRDQIWKETGWFKGNDGKDGRPTIFKGETPKPAQAGFGGPSKPGGKQPPGNALRGSLSPRVLKDAEAAANRLSPEARARLSENARSDAPLPAMQASGFDPTMFSFAQDARTGAPGIVLRTFRRLTGQPTAGALETGLQRSIEAVAGQRGRNALRVGGEGVPELPFGMRMAMPERNATRKEQTLARRAYSRAEKANKLDTPKVQRVVAAEREARIAQDILDQARLDSFNAEDIGAVVRQEIDAISAAMNRAPPNTMNLPTKGQRVSDALDDVVFGAPPKGQRVRQKATGGGYSNSESDDAAKLLFSRRYAKVWDDIVSGRTPVESIKPGSKQHLVLAVAAAGGIGAFGLANMLLADRGGPMREPEYPKPEDPRVYFDWTKQRNNRRFIENLQIRLNQIDRRYQLREDGHWTDGGNTDKVIRFWQSENDFTPDGVLTEEQAALIEEQAIDALRGETAGERNGQPRGRGSRTPEPQVP